MCSAVTMKIAPNQAGIPCFREEAGDMVLLARKFHRPSTAPEFSAGKMDKRPGRG